MIDIPFGDLKKSSYDVEGQKTIEGWQDRAIELEEQENFRVHPTTLRLVEKAQEMIKAIETRLTTEETMDDVERRALFKEKKVHQYYLALFQRSGAEELKMIAENVRNELNQ